MLRAAFVDRMVVFFYQRTKMYIFSAQWPSLPLITE